VKFLGPVLFALSVSACQGTSPPRSQLEGEPVSFVSLDGYTISKDRDATILTPKDDARKGSTIVIRSVRLDGRNDRSPEEILVATRASLEAMPEARVSSAARVEDSNLEAMQFDLSFEPRSKDGETYERQHVVLFGDAYAFHVLHTAPKGHLGDLAKDFHRVVETLEEEG